MGATLKRAALCELFFNALTPYGLFGPVALFPPISPVFRGFSGVLDSSVLRCSTSEAYKQRRQCSWFLARAPPVPSSVFPSEFGYQTPETFSCERTEFPIIEIKMG